ncbi:hypothetical protein [Desulforamulus aeronauticus]|uniref:Repeat domain-containing protein n=1 Tax=Desulforamulus aeronauticus DSM 10349 TaxID=1121421 RepID=A0A1M6TE55_9FIRM|nr:hypothetical protein [Desulforamulus aeronauticus]SHK55116.1 hypothetical protein SAMN02745123_02284 [Desulforamulus aeronauticus DSM 10349]
MKRQIRKNVHKRMCALILTVATMFGGFSTAPALAASNLPVQTEGVIAKQPLAQVPAIAICPPAIALANDPLISLGRNYQELLDLQPNGQLAYGTNNQGKKLSHVTFIEKWFDLENPVVAEYFISADKEQKIQQITVKFPKGSDRTALIKQLSNTLGEPEQGESESGSPSEYFAHWLKGGVTYDLQDFGDSLEVYLLPAFLQEAAQYQLPDNTYILQQGLADVTGDGNKKRVSLLGKRFDGNGLYMQNLYLLVEDPSQTEGQGILVKLPEESDGGYGAEMQLHDFNGDKIPDIFITANTGGSGGVYYHHIVTVKDRQAKLLYHPAEETQLNITGSFQDNYRATVTIKETKKAYTIDLKDRQSAYDEGEIYKNGKLVTPVETWHTSYNLLTPVDVNNDGVYELKGLQTIKGTCNADSIATATSLWKFTGNQWQLLEADVKCLE